MGSLTEDSATSLVVPATAVPGRESGQCFRALAEFKDYMVKEKRIEPTSSLWVSYAPLRAHACMSGCMHTATHSVRGGEAGREGR